MYPDFWHLGSYKYPYYYTKFQKLFEFYVRKSCLVLDAGCGHKGGCILTTSTNAYGVGLDIDRKNIKESVKKSKDLQLHNLAFLVGDIEELPFRKNQFDVIVSRDVLEHLKDSEKATRELAFSLKKGGKLLICTSNAFNPSSIIDGVLPKSVSEAVIRMLGGPHYYERTHYLNPWKLMEKLKKYGLAVKKLSMIGHPPFGRPSIYHYSKIKPPKIYYFWILFDKVTNAGFLKKFKEVILIVAEK